jgi:hypothetical protein
VLLVRLGRILVNLSEFHMERSGDTGGPGQRQAAQRPFPEFRRQRTLFSTGHDHR